MTTAGLGQLFRSIRLSMEDAAPKQGGPTNVTAKKKKKKTTESSSPQSLNVKPMTATHKAPALRASALASYRFAAKLIPVACTQNHLQRMPPEILMKILSYLDASSLFCIGHVSKLFYQLANNNAMWHKLYLSEFGKSKKWKPSGAGEAPEKQDATEAQEKPENHWKRLYFRATTGYDERKWKRELRDVNHCTGLPSKTERVLRNLRVTWRITVCDKSGLESTQEHSHAYFSESSVTVCWSSGDWPHDHLAGLQVHGVMRVGLNCPGVNKPGWGSLMAKYGTDTISNGPVIGTDKLVCLVLAAPGIIVGMWRGKRSVAFVMVNFHFHRLVERSLLGSSVCPYSVPEDKSPFDDVDPDYGLHDYTLHLVLHNTATQLMSGHWPRLFCRKSQIHDGHIHLTAISRCHRNQHIPMSGKISLPWRCEALQGTVENCCVMILTLLDEYRKPFWFVSTPVPVELCEKRQVSYDYEGESFLVRYADAGGAVRMELVWMEEPSQFFLIGLVVSVPLDKINRHFGTAYCD